MTSEEWAFEKINGTFGMAIVHGNMNSVRCDLYMDDFITYIGISVPFTNVNKEVWERMLFISGLDGYWGNKNCVNVHCHSVKDMQKLVKCVETTGLKAVWHESYWRKFGAKYGIC